MAGVPDQMLNVRDEGLLATGAHWGANLGPTTEAAPRGGQQLAEQTEGELSPVGAK